MRTLTEKSLFPATKLSSVPKGWHGRNIQKLSQVNSQRLLSEERGWTPVLELKGLQKWVSISVQWDRPATLGFSCSLPNLSPLQKSIAQLIQGSGVGRDMQSCPSDHGPEYGEGVSYVMCGADWT